jgi:hypothetical protein
MPGVVCGHNGFVASIFIAFHVSTSPGTGCGQSPGNAVQGFRATNQANWVESQVVIRVDS